MPQPKDINKEISDRKARVAVLEVELNRLRKEIDLLTSAAELLGVTETDLDLSHLSFDDDLDKSPVVGDLTEAAKRYGYVKEAFKTSLKFVPQDRFTVNDVGTQIVRIIPSFNLDGNKANLSGYLKEFLDAGQIELIEPGRGRLPAFYRIKK